MSVDRARRVLIVDDDASLRRLVKAVLARDYALDEASSGEEALEKLSQSDPGIVLLDMVMPGIDGAETCRRIKASRGDTRVIILSAISSNQDQVHAFEVGADDYLVKPLDAQDVRARVQLHQRFLETTASAAAIRTDIESRNLCLRQLAEERAQDIIAVQDLAVFTLAKVAESRDQETGGHLMRMRGYSQVLGEELAQGGPYAEQVGRQFLDDLYRSSPLHDIGKVGIRDEILLKPGRLTAEEFEVMQQHAVIGANILDQAVTRSQSGGFLAMAALIARFHHERFDGTGYPAGLVGKEIPLAARIVAVADVYDALTSVRPYKPAFPEDEARSTIERGSGRHFDPVIVEAFSRRFADFLRVREEAEDDLPVTFGAMAFREYDLELAGV
jgi:putative two-component system response regulator